MIDKLKQIEDRLILELLSQPNIWTSVVYNLQKPIVEKLYTKINKHIISLEFIHTSEVNDTAQKINKSTSAIHILQGSFEVDFNEIGITIFAPNGNLYFDIKSKDCSYKARSTNSASSVVMLSEFSEDLILEQNSQQIDYTRKSIIIEYFLNYFRGQYQNERLKENINIQKGDWVEFDLNLMSEYDKKSYVSILNMRGFVIKATETLIDARFGNDRVQVRSCFLKKLYVSDAQKPIEQTKKNENELNEDDEDFDPDFL